MRIAIFSLVASLSLLQLSGHVFANDKRSGWRIDITDEIFVGLDIAIVRPALTRKYQITLQGTGNSFRNPRTRFSSVVTRVHPGSQAEAVGIKEGDVILSVWTNVGGGGIVQPSYPQGGRTNKFDDPTPREVAHLIKHGFTGGAYDFTLGLYRPSTPKADIYYNLAFPRGYSVIQATSKFPRQKQWLAAQPKGQKPTPPSMVLGPRKVRKSGTDDERKAKRALDAIIEGCRDSLVASICKSALQSPFITDAQGKQVRAWMQAGERLQRARGPCQAGSILACKTALGLPALPASIREEVEQWLATAVKFGNDQIACQKGVIVACHRALGSRLATEQERQKLLAWWMLAKQFEADREACKAGSAPACDDALASTLAIGNTKQKLEKWRSDASIESKLLAFVKGLPRNIQVMKVEFPNLVRQLPATNLVRQLPASTYIMGAVALILALWLSVVLARARYEKRAKSQESSQFPTSAKSQSSPFYKDSGSKEEGVWVLSRLKTLNVLVVSVIVVSLLVLAFQPRFSIPTLWKQLVRAMNHGLPSETEALAYINQRLRQFQHPVFPYKKGILLATHQHGDRVNWPMNPDRALRANQRREDKLVQSDRAFETLKGMVEQIRMGGACKSIMGDSLDEIRSSAANLLLGMRGRKDVIRDCKIMQVLLDKGVIINLEAKRKKKRFVGMFRYYLGINAIYKPDAKSIRVNQGHEFVVGAPVAKVGPARITRNYSQVLMGTEVATVEFSAPIIRNDLADECKNLGLACASPGRWAVGRVSYMKRSDGWALDNRSFTVTRSP